MHLTARFHLQPRADCGSDAAGRYDAGLAFVDEVRAHVKTLVGGDAFAMVREKEREFEECCLAGFLFLYLKVSSFPGPLIKTARELTN